jgi:hypothetical protein
MKLYLAAAFRRQEELAGYVKRIEALGHTVTARWIWTHGNGANSMTMEAQGHEALEDLQDVLAADIVVSFTEPNAHVRAKKVVGEWLALLKEDARPSAFGQLAQRFEEELRTGRGGRHVEFGFGYMVSMVRDQLYGNDDPGVRAVVVGPLENVFHFLPDVTVFEGIEGLLGWLGEAAE